MQRQQQFRRSAKPMLLCDDDRVIVDVNRVATLLLRLPGSALKGRVLDDLVAPEQHDRLVEILARIDAGATPPAPPTEPQSIALLVPDRQRLVVDMACLPRVSEGVHLLTLEFPATGAEPIRERVLTEREREVLGQVALGRTGQEIAADLYLSPTTVESHVSRALTKLHANNRAHAVALAMRDGELGPLAPPGVGPYSGHDREHTLVALRERLRALLAAMDEGVLMLDPFRVVEDANVAAAHLLGRDPGELVGRAVHDVVYGPRSIPGALSDATPGTFVREQDSFLRADGSRMDVACTVVPYDDGDTSGSIVLFRDQCPRPRARMIAAADRAAARTVRAIRDAIDAERYVLYAQPVVALATGERWRNALQVGVTDEHGNAIAPGRVRPVAAEHGLNRGIDRWAMEQGLRLTAQGEPVEVGLAVESVTDPVYLHHLTDELERPGICAGLLTVGVPQAALSADPVQAAVFVRRVATLGGGVALVDFGFGYSGVAHLRELPWSDAKIDAALLSEIGERESSRGVVRAFVELAHGFGLHSIVRGIEDDATRGALADLGVEAGQSDRLWPARSTLDGAA